MKKKVTNAKEYSVIINLIIFFTIITVVGITRLVIILNTGKQNTEEYLYVTEDDISKDDTTGYNLNLSNTIENSYDFKIYYGDSTKRFADSVNAVVMNNTEDITSMLEKLKESLEKYPIGIIKEMKDENYTLAIYLVDHFTNDNVAVANRNSNNEFKIYISKNDTFERAFHHETFHILEYYMNLEFGEQNVFASWENVNPEGFTYAESVDKITAEYVYGQDNISPSYFITLYSKFSAKEDRAEIFAENMILENTPVFYAQEAIKNKSVLLNETLIKFFESAKEVRPNNWERYL